MSIASSALTDKSPALSNDNTGYSGGAKIDLPSVQQFSAEPQSEGYEILADDGVYEAGKELTSLSVTIQLAELPGALRSIREGGAYDEDTGIYTFGSNTFTPHLALGFWTLHGDGGYILWKYYDFKVETVSVSPRRRPPDPPSTLSFRSTACIGAAARRPASASYCPYSCASARTKQ